MNSLSEFLIAFQGLFSSHIVFSMGLLLGIGYIMGKLAEKCRLPSITGYIIAGLLLGESLLHLVPEGVAGQLNSITEIALGLIAITIGAEFEYSRLRRTGGRIMTITALQAVLAFVFVVGGLWFTELDWGYILILGAIATATAPAATVIIVKELRARGEFIDYLFGVVAIDDALCVILFSIVFAVAAPALAPLNGADGGLGLAFMHAFTEIGLSIVLGFAGGFLLNLAIRSRHKPNEVLIISLAMIFLTTAAAIVLGYSLLIANMTLGAVLVNLSHRNKRVFRAIEPITPPIFALFFVLAGTELNLGVFAEGMVVIYGLIYMVTRFAGKYAGTYAAALMTKSSSAIRNYLGFCLFPQAGVAIGLILFVQTSPRLTSPGVPDVVKTMLVLTVNIVLLSIFVNELIGPSITKFGIKRGADLE